MTDYVAYTPAEYAPDAPATALHFQRWFENWIAGFEGSPGAPRLLDAALSTLVTPEGTFWVGNRMAGLATASVGTFCLLSDQTNSGSVVATRNPGTLLAGSSLIYASAANGLVSGPPGTWRSCGASQFAQSSVLAPNAPSRVTLWMRIS